KANYNYNYKQNLFLGCFFSKCERKVHNMVNKTITYIKQYFFMLALVATFVGFSAFKFVEKFDEPEDGWYSLSIINEELEDPDIPSNLEIGAKLLTAPPSTGLGCAQDNTGYRCAVHLSF